MNINFDAEKQIEGIIAWIREWFAANGPKASAVIGISGGKDSTIVAALLARALGRDRVVGVLMPDGIQMDIHDSEKVVEALGIRSFTVNVHDGVEGVFNALMRDTDLTIRKDARINLPPLIRMATL